MTLFYSLLLAHLVADFFQPAWLVKWTKQSTTGLLTHVAGYTVLTALALAGYGPIWWLWLVVLGLVHLSLDRIKYLINAKLSRLSVVVFVLDQAAHIAVIAAVAFLTGLSSGRPALNIISRYSSVLPYLVAYIVISFAGSIFVFEWGKIFVPAQSGSNNAAVILWKDRILGMAERSLALTLVLVKLYFLVPLAFLPSLGILIRKWQSQERTKLLGEFVASLLVTLVVSLLVVFFL